MLNTVIFVGFFVLLAVSVAVVVVVAVSKKRKNAMPQGFLKAESNLLRKMEIDPELFFEPDLTQLPQLPEGDPHDVELAASRTMIYFKEPISDMHLSRQYSPAQMSEISGYRENFNHHLKTLTNWANSLAEIVETTEDALLVLGYVIAHGAEDAAPYKLAAELYAEYGAVEILEALIDTVEAREFRNAVTRDAILDFIGDRIDELSR
ncbi:MAG: hypothetical protein FWC78_03310 [Defluviitaleaceae bacterium]|nr:hypothetical protein [Defluviitaleaceae bacterium]